MTKWLRQRLIAGFFVTVPLAVSVFTLTWLFRQVDGLTSGLSERLFGRYVPGLGILMTALIVLVVGTIAANVVGRRLLRQVESLVMHVPLLRTIYAPVRQLTVAFSPGGESGFKRVALVDRGDRGWAMGFVTREFSVDRGTGPERLLAVYLPTNNLYLGDVVICPPSQVVFPDLTVEQGLKVFLTGGMALPPELHARPASPPKP